MVVTDLEGVYQKGYHLKEELVRISEDLEDRPGGESLFDPEQFKYIDMFGFHVDQTGTFFFTVPALFSAFSYVPDLGELAVFGAAGSGPGKFGVVAGITTDGKGNIYVSDRLRSVVMIFNSNLEFQTEFGFRGLNRGNLIVPDDLVVDGRRGYVYA